MKYLQETLILYHRNNYLYRNKFGLQRVKMYEDKSIQDKVRSMSPINKIEAQAKEKSKGVPYNIVFHKTRMTLPY